MKPAPLTLLAALFLSAAPLRADVFKDANAGFSIIMPNDWKQLSPEQSADLIPLVSPTPKFDSIVTFTAPKSRLNLPALIIQQSDYPDSATRTTISPADLDALASTMTGPEPSPILHAASPMVPPLTDTQNFFAASFNYPPGFVIETRSHDNFRTHSLVFAGKSHLILLHFVCDDPDYSRIRIYVDSITRSFTFDPSQKITVIAAKTPVTSPPHALPALPAAGTPRAPMSAGALAALSSLALSGVFLILRKVYKHFRGDYV